MEAISCTICLPRSILSLWSAEIAINLGTVTVTTYVTRHTDWIHKPRTAVFSNITCSNTMRRSAINALHSTVSAGKPFTYSALPLCPPWQTMSTCPLPTSDQVCDTGIPGTFWLFEVKRADYGSTDFTVWDAIIAEIQHVRWGIIPTFVKATVQWNKVTVITKRDSTVLTLSEVSAPSNLTLHLLSVQDGHK